MCNEIKNKCLKLINNDNYLEAINTIDEYVNKSNSKQAYLLAANVYCWCSSKTLNMDHIEKGLYFSKLSQGEFRSYYYQKFQDTKLNFVLPITLPKSGGTYIFNFLHKNIGYSDVYNYVFGAPSCTYLCKYRTKIISEIGGTLLHNHLLYKQHNIDIIKKLNLPIWIHIRDPRDSYFSFLNMYTKSNNDSFVKNTNKTFNQDFKNKSRDYMAKNCLGMLRFYCEFIKYWFEFQHINKTITFYKDFQNNNQKFLELLCSDILKIEIDNKIEIPKKDWNNRFYRGIDKQWYKFLDTESIRAIEDVYDEYSIDYIFDE